MAKGWCYSILSIYNAAGLYCNQMPMCGKAAHKDLKKWGNSNLDPIDKTLCKRYT